MRERGAEAGVGEPRFGRRRRRVEGQSVADEIEEPIEGLLGGRACVADANPDALGVAEDLFDMRGVAGRRPTPVDERTAADPIRERIDEDVRERRVDRRRRGLAVEHDHHVEQHARGVGLEERGEAREQRSDR